MTIHENLRRLRLEKGMTQEQTAERIGMTRQAVSSYESGRTRPDIDTLLRLSEAYCVDLDAILYGESAALKSARTLKRTALGFGIALLVLTLLSSALCWATNRVIPVQDNMRLTEEQILLLETRFRLMHASELLGGPVRPLTLIGSVVLFVEFLMAKCRIAQKKRLLCLTVWAAAMLLASVPWALTDRIYAPADYLITPLLCIIDAVLFFVILLVVEAVRRRRSAGGEKQESV